MAKAATVGIGFHAVVLVALPLFRQDLSPVEQGISEYAVGGYGLV